MLINPINRRDERAGLSRQEGRPCSVLCRGQGAHRDGDGEEPEGCEEGPHPGTVAGRDWEVILLGGKGTVGGIVKCDLSGDYGSDYGMVTEGLCEFYDFN